MFDMFMIFYNAIFKYQSPPSKSQNDNFNQKNKLENVKTPVKSKISPQKVAIDKMAHIRIISTLTDKFKFNLKITRVIANGERIIQTIGSGHTHTVELNFDEATLIEPVHFTSANSQSEVITTGSTKIIYDVLSIKLKELGINKSPNELRLVAETTSHHNSALNTLKYASRFLTNDVTRGLYVTVQSEVLVGIETCARATPESLENIEKFLKYLKKKAENSKDNNNEKGNTDAANDGNTDAANDGNDGDNGGDDERNNNNNNDDVDRSESDSNSDSKTSSETDKSSDELIGGGSYNQLCKLYAGSLKRLEVDHIVPFSSFRNSRYAGNSHGRLPSVTLPYGIHRRLPSTINQNFRDRINELLTHNGYGDALFACIVEYRRAMSPECFASYILYIIQAIQYATEPNFIVDGQAKQPLLTPAEANIFRNILQQLREYEAIEPDYTSPDAFYNSVMRHFDILRNIARNLINDDRQQESDDSDSEQEERGKRY